MPDLSFNAKARSESNTKTIVETDCFKMTIDEPAGLGGTNEGANPVQYLLAALAGCLNVMGHIVANEMGFELRCLDIHLDGDLDPAKLFGKSNEKRAGYSEIRVTLKPDTDADENTLVEWLAIVEDRCPVSDNLKNPTPVIIKLA